MWCPILTHILLLSINLASIVQGQAQTKTVYLDQGPVRGFRDPTFDLFAFRGVPYAMEPKGENKYKAPLPAPTWTETFDAVASWNMCPQPLFSLPGLIPDNCLVANIYVPDTEATNLPVLVMVHGGGYTAGFGDYTQPKSLVNSKRIIAVSVNYRLGVHGFLCLGTESIPGNAGLKDQAAAIRWVSDNIAKFGGNPNDITFTGFSGGSCNVNLHLLSKMSRGLFQKLIPESLSDISPLSTQLDPIENAKKVARYFSSSLDVDDFKSLEDFFVQLPVTEFVKISIGAGPDYNIPMAPCVEKDIGLPRFLEASPYSIIKSKDYPKVPKLEGFTNMEGLLEKTYFESRYPEMNEDFSLFLPADLQFESKEQKDEVARQVKQFYFGNKDVGPDTSIQYFEYYSDIGFSMPILRSIKLHLEAGLDTYYLYEYAFVDEDTPYIPYTYERGADHVDQTYAIYEAPFDKIGSEEYQQMRATLRELWLNFITDGQPVLQSSESTPAWPKLQKLNSPYMLLNQTLTVHNDLLQRKFDFWEKIYDKHYREPQPPNNGTQYFYFSLLTLISSFLVIWGIN